ncbi:hypothetical protein CMV_030120 [Castanea mollissima]|uniref:Reverse transcriptase zinc-binding domain-containing protein n=1 Tax=Castanea mollissima TaxID=60419 RepID=A0A8J4Q5U2_9ROSI|nr:hypothetical protein CMV_030120 [Castanea mollissima]
MLCEAEAVGVPLGSTEEGVKKFWKSIWCIKVPNKVKVFLWLACSSALPTKAGLHKRKIVDDNLCDQCLVEIEDEVHAIWSCDCVRDVWEAPFVVARTKNPWLNSMCDLVYFIAKETRELEKFAMVARAVWQSCNKLRLKEDITPIHKVYKSALSLLTEFQQKKSSLTSQRQSRPNCWLPPPPNSVKFNFDGAVFNDLNEKVQILSLISHSRLTYLNTLSLFTPKRTNPKPLLHQRQAHFIDGRNLSSRRRPHTHFTKDKLISSAAENKNSPLVGDLALKD